MTRISSVRLNGGERVPFANHTAYCVGTGRVSLALHEEYQKQLRRVQDLCHFRYIRGHGLFSDQLGIYQERKTPDGQVRVEYCFTYLDRVVDAWQSCGLRPFLELGFMPKALASGTQTIFYWRGHVTPPRDMKAWTDLVQATLRHLCERYGAQEVSTWPCEIWNEPNLKGFWENADKEKYLELYRATALAVKEAVPQMRVGGPAICGGEGSQEWIRDFLTFCRDNRLPVDFVSRHAYMGQTPEHRGRYLYHKMCRVEDTVEEMRVSRGIIDSFPEYKGLPMYITEFNTSYNPFCPIHDTNLNAAYCAGLLSQLGDVADGYSYWTFGDVFEEQGIPPRPFHGGFGMVAEGAVEKPSVWAFSYFSRLRGEAVYRDERALLTRTENGGFEGIFWNICQEEAENALITLDLPADGQQYVLLSETVDEAHGNVLKAWHDLGEPASLGAEEQAFLHSAAAPLCRTEAVQAENGRLKASVTLSPNAVSYCRLVPVKVETDEGYDYDWYETKKERK